jgi:hypothetical protein
MKRQKKFTARAYQEDYDPLSGMANLFDVAMVFAVALMVAFVAHFKMTDLLQSKQMTIVKNPGKKNMEILIKKGKKITKYKASEAKNQSSGKGKKVGSAYELENGDIIYVPD